MKKILVFSPVRGCVPVNYMRGIIALLNSSLCKGPNPEYHFECAWTSGTSVAMARCEGADLFMRRGDDELISWDIDLGIPDPQILVSMFARLLSHDVDIVGGAYVGHNFNSQWHGAATSPDAKMNERGLLPMAQIPLGFSKVKRRVFEKIKKDNPHLEYVFRETQMEQAKPNMFEFYPNGVVGPNTGQGKVERIKEVLKDYKTCAANFADYLDRIHAIVHDNDYSKNVLMGEDFYFCKLARDSGFELFIDNNLLVPHKSEVLLPVKNQDLLKELLQEWRLANNANPEEVKALIAKLRPHLNNDIP